MPHQDFCREHEEVKACTKGVITWPKFITILISLVVLSVSTATAINNHIFGTIDKAEARCLTKVSEVETASVERDKRFSDDLKEYIEKYAIPTREDVAVIKEQVKALKR